MAFTQELRFSDLTKLMEAVATNKSVKKRDEFVTDYFTKLHKYRKEFIEKNKDKVSCSRSLSADSALRRSTCL